MLWGDLINQVFQYLLSLLVAVARLFPCLLLTPVFNFVVIKGMLRNAIALALALFISPVVYQGVQEVSPPMMTLAAIAIKELIIGTLIGLILAMPFWMYESVGGLFDNQRGALMGGQINPSLGPDATPLGFMMKQVIILLLVIGPGLSVITQLLWDSYRLWPVMDWLPPLTERGWEVWQGLLKETFATMVLYAGPLVALLLLIDFAVGVISIYSPQLQATVLAIPLKCLAGLLFFIAYLPLLNYLAGERLFELRDLSAILTNLFDIKKGAAP